MKVVHFVVHMACFIVTALLLESAGVQINDFQYWGVLALMAVLYFNTILDTCTS